MALNIIDFSHGIRPEEIQENFEYLQDQLSRERVSVGGAGISSGLEITVHVDDENFYIEVGDGSIINNDGDEVFIQGMKINIDPPILYQCKELITLSEERTATLKHSPYALDRRKPSEHLSSYEPELSGIDIKYENSVNQDDYIRVRNIINKTLTVSGALSRNLEITYRYTAKRIDTLYLDDDFNIKIKQGTTSTTPSAILPSDAKYLIAYLEINHEYKDEQNTTDHAYIYVKDDLRTIRNLYTAKDGTLYICGIPFDDLQIIHLLEPANPKPNTLWLNVADNTLYCWRSTDEFTYKNKIDVDTDFINQANADLIFSTYMDFLIGENELSVYLNNNKLNLGVDYEEIANVLPTYGGNDNEGETTKRGNSFRILQSMIRMDGYEDTLIPGDVLVYTINYKDSQYMWVPINKMNYINVKNTKVYSTYYDGIDEKFLYDIDEYTGVKHAYFDSYIANSLGVNPDTEYPYKYQYFLFDREKDLDMHFTPHRKELSVMINQMYLHEDQFREITVFDLYEKKLPTEIVSAAAENFGWTTEYLTNYFNGEYDNSGIGFMLIEPLDSGAEAESLDYKYPNGSNDLFVEAIVERRICSTPVNRKLERSATFVYEDFLNIDETFNNIIDLGRAKYRYNEHQLEVYIDGIKQVEGIDYIEEYGFFKEYSGEISTDDLIIPPIDDEENYLDQDYFIRKKAALCNKFKILDTKSVSIGSVISYRITTNIYSYDHINNILDNIGDTLTSCETTVKEYTETMNSLRLDMESRIGMCEQKVNDISDDRSQYLTTDSILNIGQMPNVIVTNAVKSLNHINTSIKLVQDRLTYTLTDIWPEDYINVFYHNNANNFDNYWMQGVHYRIVAVGNSTCYLEILDKNLFRGDDLLYISGIKLSGVGREL